MKKFLSVISKIFLVLFTLLFGVLAIGGDMAAANAATLSKFLGQGNINKVEDETIGADDVDSENFKTEYESVAA